MRTPILYLITFIMSFISSFAFGCTTVFWNNNGKALVVARSTDLYTSDLPMIIARPRGESHSGEADKNSLTWNSKFGSVVVTAFHSYAVSDGINEKGLAAHILYLSGTQYPENGSNQLQISNLMWAQYILDNFSTVDEALKGTKNLQLVGTKVSGKIWPIHLTMEDATGDSAVIEFIQGKMHIYRKKAPSYTYTH